MNKNGLAMEKTPSKNKTQRPLQERVFDRVNIVTLLIDPITGIILYANPAACNYYGYSFDQFVSLNIGHINPQPLAETLDNLQKASLGQKDYYTTMHKTINGEIRYVGINSGPFEINGKSLVLAFVHDNTSQKAIDDRLRSLSQAVEQSPASIVITNTKGIIDYVNPVFTTITGYEFDEAIGRSPAILKTGDGNRVEIREMWQTILSGQIWHGEFCNHKKNGDIYWESASISPVLDEKGTITHFVAVKEDITENRKVQIQIEESLRFNQAILNISPIGIIICNSSGPFIHVNPAAGLILDESPDFLKNQNYRTLKPWKDYGLFDITNKVIETGETISNEFFYVSTSGKEIWLNGICAPFHSGDDLNLLFMFEDITARKVAEANLKKVSSQMELWVSQLEKRNDTSTALREMGAMLQVCSNQTEAMAVIKQFGSRLFPTSSGGVFLAGFPSTIVETFEYWGETLSSEVVFSIEDCWSLRRSLIHTVHGVSEGLRCQHMPEGFRGTYIDVPLLSSSDLLGLLHIEWPEIHKIDQETRELIETVAEHLSLSISNIRLRESLRAQSIRDPLTGVFNRRFMEESLERELPRARRKKSHVGIMLMDLDHFKMFNDLYGHEAGDLVLKEISNVLRTAIRKEDIVCRFGGEEFVVILPEADLDITNKRAELIRKEVSEIRLTYEEKQLNAITMSIGVAVYPDHGESSNIVLKAADAALYRAKEEGRNRVVVANQGF